MPVEALRHVDELTRRGLRLEVPSFAANIMLGVYFTRRAAPSPLLAIMILFWGLALVFHAMSLRSSERLLRIADLAPPPRWLRAAAAMSMLAGVVLAGIGLLRLVRG